jgi:gliding motility-associated lipoprotein GldH
MRNFANHLLAVLMLLVSFSACDKTRVYDRYKQIPDSIWHKDSIFIFEVPVDDTLQNHNLLIQIRNETSYRFSNLWFFIEITQPDGETIKDTFEVLLAEPSGQWLGKGFGGLKTSQVIYRRNVYFPVRGTYSVALQHGMREEELEGIHDVGFRVEKTSK